MRVALVLKSSQNFRGCSLLVDVFPKYKFFVRILMYMVWKGDYYPNLPQSLPIIMRKRLSWDDLYQYLQTWSSLHTFQERFPGSEDII